MPVLLKICFFARRDDFESRKNRSVEDAAQAIDSSGVRRRVFFAFGGPIRAMGHSLTVAASMRRPVFVNSKFQKS